MRRTRPASPLPQPPPAAGNATRWPALLLLGVLLAGCAHAPLNTALPPANPDRGYTFGTQHAKTTKGKLVVSLYLSGGGTRAAALSYGVLQELARTGLVGGDRMLDHVVSISAVSGGSFPAAYYCLYGDRLFQDFETAFLKRDVQDALMRRAGSPANLLRLASGRFARSDLAAEYYDRILFHGATFGDLLRSPEPRPFLLINATDMDSFSHFPFTQESFDLIGSDLATFPIARAVAASSAVPLVLTPITVKNYGGCLPPEVTAAPTAVTDARRQEIIAQLAHRYLDAGQRPYIHLLDGGLADNLGLSDLIGAITLAGGWDALLRSEHPGEVAQVAIIVVNAATQPDTEWRHEPRAPGLRSVVSALSRSEIARTNNALLELVRESLNEWRSHAGPDQPQVHLIAIGFDQLPDPVERAYFNQIPTTLHLPANTVDRLIDVGGRLLRESLEYQAMLAKLPQSPRNPAPTSAPTQYPVPESTRHTAPDR